MKDCLLPLRRLLILTCALRVLGTLLGVPGKWAVYKFYIIVLKPLELSDSDYFMFQIPYNSTTVQFCTSRKHAYFNAQRSFF